MWRRAPSHGAYSEHELEETKGWLKDGVGLDLSRPFFGTGDLSASNPALKRWAYSRLSLRDTKAAVFPRRQYEAGVDQYDFWVMTSSWAERKRRVKGCCKSQRS